MEEQGDQCKVVFAQFVTVPSLHRTLPLPHPISQMIPDRSNPAKTIMHCSPSSSMPVTSVVDPDLHQDPQHFGNLDPHPIQIKIRIRIPIKGKCGSGSA
jgi:hypothetical protein